MDWRRLAIPPLMLLAAAAAPPEDCTQHPNVGQMLPAPNDLVGRPAAPAGLSGQTFATIPSLEGAVGCHTALPSASKSTTLQSESGDVLHGLPTPDILRRMDEPKRAPEFQ